MALGSFSIAYIAHRCVRAKAAACPTWPTRFPVHLDDLAAIAEEKGTIHRLLDEKWRNVH